MPKMGGVSPSPRNEGCGEGSCALSRKFLIELFKSGFPRLLESPGIVFGKWVWSWKVLADVRLYI